MGLAAWNKTYDDDSIYQAYIWVSVATFSIKLFYLLLTVKYITDVMMFYVSLENNIFAQYILLAC